MRCNEEKSHPTRLEAERLEAGGGVEEYIAEAVVVEPLGDGPRGRVHDETNTALHVANEAIGDAILDHGVRRKTTRAVHEEADDVSAGIRLGNGFQGGLGSVPCFSFLVFSANRPTLLFPTRM